MNCTPNRTISEYVDTDTHATQQSSLNMCTGRRSGTVREVRELTTADNKQEIMRA